MNEFFVKNERNVNNDYNVIQKHVKLLQKELKQEYEDIKLGFTRIDNPLFTLEEYIYGWSMVNSRNFFVQDTAYINGGRAVLVPFGDLMNHGGNNDEKLQWKFNEEKNTLVAKGVTPTEKISKLLSNFTFSMKNDSKIM